MTPPTMDPALRIELGWRVVVELMTQADWLAVLDRLEAWADAPLADDWTRP